MLFVEKKNCKFCKNVGHKLRIELDEDGILNFYLDNKMIFLGDYADNFDELFFRALQIWSDYKYEVRKKDEKQ